MKLKWHIERRHKDKDALLLLEDGFLNYQYFPSESKYSNYEEFLKDHTTELILNQNYKQSKVSQPRKTHIDPSKNAEVNDSVYDE